jgi:hypothetical protein
MSLTACRIVPDTSFYPCRGSAGGSMASMSAQSAGLVTAGLASIRETWRSRRDPNSKIPLGMRISSFFLSFAGTTVVLAWGLWGNWEYDKIGVLVTAFTAGILGAMIGFFMPPLPVDVQRWATERFALVGLAIGMATAPSWYWFGQVDIHADYYTTTAGIIALIVVGSLIDLRQQVRDRRQVALVVVVAAIAEFACLTELAFDLGDAITFALSGAGLMAVFTSLAIQLVHS